LVGDLRDDSWEEVPFEGARKSDLRDYADGLKTAR